MPSETSIKPSFRIRRRRREGPDDGQFASAFIELAIKEPGSPYIKE